MRRPSPYTINPTRIQFRVPNDHYTRLHLIAAAGDEPNSVPVVTAQFHKALSGYPQDFTARFPLFTAKPSGMVELPAPISGMPGNCPRPIVTVHRLATGSFFRPRTPTRSVGQPKERACPPFAEGAVGYGLNVSG
jgi:hypothetical protein